MKFPCTAFFALALFTAAANAFAGCQFSQEKFEASGQDARFRSTLVSTCPRLSPSNCSLNPACQLVLHCVPTAEARRRGVINCSFASAPSDPDCSCTP